MFTKRSKRVNHVNIIRKTSSSRTNSSQVIHFLEDYVENQNKKNDENMKKIEKMHKEKMEIFSGFLSVLRNMKD